MDRGFDISDLMEFLNTGLTSYHVVENIKERLSNKGFEPLGEDSLWEIKPNGKHFVVRNDSSIIAFRIPECGIDNIKGVHVFAAHSDSPAFKIKQNPTLVKEGMYVSLNTEKYGGMILNTWMDRPLTIAGRVCLLEEDTITSHTVKLKDNICMIPNLAIHMNRDINNGQALNPQNDMLPLISLLPEDGEGHKELIDRLISEALSAKTGKQIKKEDILSWDLFVENSEKAQLAGVNDEFLMAPRYDDLGCVYAGMKALESASPDRYIDLLAIFDNEEVGSLTRQGADSTFLRDTLDNIAYGLGVSDAVLRTWIAGSFMLSADNAHACHPNQGALADPTNRPCLNKGIVLKFHGSQKYATDAYSAAYVRRLCRECEICCQSYANRSDIAGGSTLGNLAMAQVSMPAADIGLPQLAMHSAYETAGINDMDDMIRLAEKFFKE